MSFVACDETSHFPDNRRKRENAALSAIGEDTTVSALKTREKQAELRSFISQTGLKRQSSREQIGGVASKARGKLDSARAGVYTGGKELFAVKDKSREAFTFISDKRFDDLTISARKQGAVIIRGTEEVEKHLDKMNASASTIGNMLLFRQNVCASEVLEETFHFTQNLGRVNDDKGEPLRTILNEISAKEYILENSKKYKVPRNELELVKKQLEGYRKQLEALKGDGDL